MVIITGKEYMVLRPSGLISFFVGVPYKGQTTYTLEDAWKDYLKTLPSWKSALLFSLGDVRLSPDDVVVPKDSDRERRFDVRYDMAEIRKIASDVLGSKATDHFDCGVLPDSEIQKIQEARRLLAEVQEYRHSHSGADLGKEANRALISSM